MLNYKVISNGRVQARQTIGIWRDRRTNLLHCLSGSFHADFYQTGKWLSSIYKVVVPSNNVIWVE